MKDQASASMRVERVQTGVRMEKRLVKVLKALAEYHDQSLGELLENIALHAFDNAPAFHDETFKHIALLKEVYGLEYQRHDNRKFTETAQK